MYTQYTHTKYIEVINIHTKINPNIHYRNLIKPNKTDLCHLNIPWTSGFSKCTYRILSTYLQSDRYSETQLGDVVGKVWNHTFIHLMESSLLP